MALLEQQDFIRLGGGLADGGQRRRSATSGGRPSAPHHRQEQRFSPYGRPARARDWRLREHWPSAGSPVWMPSGKVYSTGIVGLHEEIEDFFQYISPTPEEHQMRTCLFESIRDVILGIWQHAKVFKFGSFETGLYLPTSDIDIVVIGKWKSAPLDMLKDALIKAGICHPDSIKVLHKAAVPIVKLTDRRTDVKIDITFNRNDGLTSASSIKRYQAEFPHMPKLVMLLKQFLQQRELNEVFTGGVGSYSLILMSVSFLQTHERPLAAFPGCNLGVLLLEFLELYGIKFNYDAICIRVKEKGYAPRREVEHQFVSPSVHNSPLCIEDPHDVSNDIGRSSYNMRRVQEAFRHAYHRLSFSVLAPGGDDDPNRCSLLGRIVQVPDTVVQYRDWIRLRYPVSEPDPAHTGTHRPHGSAASPLADACSDGEDVCARRPPARQRSPSRTGLLPIDRPHQHEADFTWRGRGFPTPRSQRGHPGRDRR